MNYWLLKSEPSAFSIDDLAKRPKKTEPWDGVRNYQARNLLRDEIKVGDLAFFYNSNCDVPGIAGIVKIVKSGYADSTAFNPESKYFDPKSSPAQPRWYRVDVQLQEKFPHTIPLAELKTLTALQEMVLVTHSRLSVQPVTAKQWRTILALVGK